MYCIAFLPTSETLKYKENKYCLFTSINEANKFIDLVIPILKSTEPEATLKRIPASNFLTRQYIIEVLEPILRFSEQGLLKLKDEELAAMFSVQEIELEYPPNYGIAITRSRATLVSL